MRKVTVCAVPYEMSIIEGGVLFSNKSGFYGVSARYTFAVRNHLWYLEDRQETFPRTALCHLVKMSELLKLHIGGDHEVDEKKPLKFKQVEGYE